MLFGHVLIFVKINFSEKICQEYHEMLNSLDPDQAQQVVGPDLGPNCLQRLSADDSGRQRVKALQIK